MKTKLPRAAGVSTIGGLIDAAVGCVVCGAALGRCCCWDDLCTCFHPKEQGVRTCERPMHGPDLAAMHCVCDLPAATRRACADARHITNPCRCLCHKGRGTPKQIEAQRRKHAGRTS